MSFAAEQENDPVAWLEQYGDRLYRFARARVVDSFVAEDLLQETLLAAYRSREKFSGKSTVSTWLTGILRHKIADHYRSLRPESGDETLDAFADGTGSLFDEKEKWKIKPGDWGNAPENVYERKELLTVLGACLDEMPVKMSRVYRLREMEGVATETLCEQFQLEKNNCWVILYRARMLLRRCLEINWFGEKKMGEKKIGEKNLDERE